MPCRSNVSSFTSAGASSPAARSTAALYESLRRLPANPSTVIASVIALLLLHRNQNEDEPPDGERENGQGHADPRVLHEADLHAPLARGLGHDEVGDGAEQGEVARQRGRHGENQPGAVG